MSYMRQKETVATMVDLNWGNERGMEAQPLANQQSALAHSSSAFFCSLLSSMHSLTLGDDANSED
jgi:hypothetical protein